MSLPNYLARIKSAGVYRYTFDKSVIPQETLRTLRLLVGYSEKGPFNTPVYIETSQEFIATFGNISRRLERKGIFFHRLALQALAGGPILCFNLKPFNLGKTGDGQGDPEKTSIVAFNALDLYKGNPIVPESVDVVSTSRGSRSQRLSSVYDTNRFWTVDERRVHDIKMTKENKFDYIRIVQTGSRDDSSTIFIRKADAPQFHVRIGDWYANNNEEMPVYMEAIRDRYLDEYFAEVYVFRGKFAPEQFSHDGGTLGHSVQMQFVYETDNNGDPVYYDTQKTKPVLKTIKCYSRDGKREFVEFEITNNKAISNKCPQWAQDLFTTNKVNQPSTEHEKLLSWVPMVVIKDGAIVINDDYRDNYGMLADALEAMSGVSTSNHVGTYTGILFPEFKDGNGRIVSLDRVFNNDFQIHQMLMSFNDKLLDEAADMDVDGDYDMYSEGHGLHIKSKSVKQGETGETDNHYDTVAGFVHALTSPFYQVNKTGGILFENKDEAGKKTADKSKAKDTSRDEKIDETDKFASGEDGRTFDNSPSTSVYGIYMKGYTYNSIQKADSGRDLQSKIFTVLGYKGIVEALTNNVDSDWHYLVDTFQTYPGFSMKSILSEITKTKDNGFALLNAPTMLSIMEHCGFSKYDGGFDMKEITNPNNGISLPTESQGASWCAFYTQLVMQDGGAKYTIPSAALVSNLFMVKYGPRLPYNIVAGPNYGTISFDGVIGPDYSYARKDLDVLEPFGINAIVHFPRYGTVINSNQTAKQTPVSALSKVHVRELVIFLQNEIETMLRSYQWELNTPSLRTKVKAKADAILELCKDNGGVYAYTTRCDDTNNTPEVIDNEMIVLDVDIEAARGAGKMVQTLTLHRTGTLQVPK